MSSYFHSASQSCPILSANCRYNLRLFRLFRGDSSGMDKSSSAKCLLYSDVVKGEPSPTGRGRRSRDEKGNQGVGDIRFTNILQLFSIYFFFSITLLYHFFLYRLSKKSFVVFHMARDEGSFILDWRQFYQPKNRSVRLDQSEYLPRTLGDKAVTHKY